MLVTMEDYVNLSIDSKTTSTKCHLYKYTAHSEQVS